MALQTRIRKLEQRRTRGRHTNRVVLFDPETTTADATLAALNVGKKSGKPVLLVASWNGDEAWRAALRAQQRTMIAANVARPHTTKQAPKHTTPEHEDVLAPGMKTKRRVERQETGPLKFIYTR